MKSLGMTVPILSSCFQSDSPEMEHHYSYFGVDVIGHQEASPCRRQHAKRLGWPGDVSHRDMGRALRPSWPHVGANVVTTLSILSASPPGGPQEWDAAVQGESEGLLNTPSHGCMSLILLLSTVYQLQDHEMVLKATVERCRYNGFNNLGVFFLLFASIHLCWLLSMESDRKHVAWITPVILWRMSAVLFSVDQLLCLQ